MNRPTAPPIEQPDFARIRRTGEWWTSPWWFDSNVHSALGVDVNRVNAALDRVRGLFPSPWYLEEDRKLAARKEWHPALRLLTSGAIMGVVCLLELADVLDAIENAKAGAPGLRSRLLTGGEFEGAMSEGNVARLLQADGLPYSFGGRTGHDGPSFDLTVHSDPVPFCIEVTRVLNKWDEGPVAHLRNRVMFGLLSGLSGRSYGVELDGGLVEMLPGFRSGRLQKEMNPDLKLAELLAERFIQRTMDAARATDGEFTVEEPGVGNAQVSARVPGHESGATGPTQGCINGPSIDTRTMARKLALVVLEKAIRQLPEAHPGILVATVPYASMDLAFAEMLLKATMASVGRRLSHLSGVVVRSSVLRTSGIRPLHLPISNTEARVPMGELPWPSLRPPPQIPAW